jgi:hypothetical protein
LKEAAREEDPQVGSSEAEQGSRACQQERADEYATFAVDVGALGEQW